MALFLLTLVTLMGLGASAGQLDDFSNNLATDIGPLLALFGDDVTKQFLSESTLFIDYLIFALAPIGIMTAIVSAIRVCGDPSLRAFIGRSREGDADVEAELCTSTSRDVCELFNKGGITRVFGSPQILEIVQIQKDPIAHSAEMGIYLFRDRLRQLPDGGLDDWEEVKRISFFERTLKVLAVLSRLSIIDGITIRERQPNVESPPVVETRWSQDSSSMPNSTRETFVQNPNLSINVGIIKRHIIFFYAVAFIGILLQGGVIAMAGVVCWKLQWTQDGPPDRVVDVATVFSMNHEPLIFALGTVFLCSGMFWCAALIGQITDERWFRRKRATKRGPANQSTLFWLQPGNQQVGDQTFDAFAYTEDSQKPLHDYTTSRKKPRDGFYKYTWGAVIFTIGGYIAQFIGLRGMNAYISIAQLGVIVAMSLLRAALRMQRLGDNDNQLVGIPDIVAGFELDWLAFELAKQDLNKLGDLNSGEQRLWFWHCTGQYDKGSGTGGSSQSPNEHKSPVQKLLLYRTRLAHLTGHHPFHEISQWSFQEWPDKQVKVRVKARELAKAICATAEALFDQDDPKGLEGLGFFATISNPGLAIPLQDFIKLTLEVPGDSVRHGWRIDSAIIEGILGLWLWSLMSVKEFKIKNKNGSNVSIADNFPRARIISACADNDMAHIMQRELELWLGTDMVKVLEAVLDLGKERIHDSSILWQRDRTEQSEIGVWKPTVWKSCEEDEQPKHDRKEREDSPSRNYGHPMKVKTPTEDWKRFFGWNMAPASSALLGPAIRDTARASEGENITVQFANCQAQNDLLTECSQDLYSTVLSSMISVANIKIGEIIPSQVSGHLRLENAKVSGAVTAFTENGLGSHSDAICCIIPTLRPHLRPPEGDSMIPSLIGAAARFRRNDNWDAAEKLVHWACAFYTPQRGGSLGRDQNTRDNKYLPNAIIIMGEFYRWGFISGSSKKERALGYQGLENMHRSFNTGLENQADKDVLERYYQVGLQIAELYNELQEFKWPANNSGDPQPPRSQDLLGAIEALERTETLYLLCTATTRSLRYETPTVLSAAARNDWSEVTMALLDLGALVNGSDDQGRVAISYYAERGNVPMTKILLEHGASLKVGDENGRTPLWWAAQNDHSEVVKLLLDSGDADPDGPDIDGRTPLSQAAGNGREAVVKHLISSNLVILDSKDSTGRTPLSWAAGNGEDSTVRLLVDRANVGIELRDEMGRTPLSWAARNGHEKTVGLLLTDGNAEPNSRDSTGRTPLSLAAGAGHGDVVRVLLDKKTVIPDLKDFGEQTPLLWAARKGHEHVVRLLLSKAHVEVNAPDSVGRTPLWWAARNGNEKVVRLLLDENAKPDSADSTRRTPLWWAVTNEHEAVVRLLLGTNAVDINFEDDEWMSPLKCARRYNFVGVLLGA